MSGLLVLPYASPHFTQDHESTSPLFSKLTLRALQNYCAETFGTDPPDFSTMSSSSGRKRKAEDDLTDARMGQATPSPSPAPMSTGRSTLPRPRQIKRPKTNVSGRQLALPRLLETLNPEQLRGVLRTICEQRPEIGNEIISNAPRPSVSSAVNVLSTYQTSMRDSFPYGDRPTSDYAYNRVRQALANLLDALKDYTPQFLPPHEQQSATSLDYLDRATSIVHDLPDWDSYQHNRYKQEAYEDMSQAWALVIREAAKKGGGIQLQYNGWDQKLAKHNESSGGRMQDAVSELRSSLGWMNGSASETNPGNVSPDVMSIRQQLMSNTYGANAPIQVGPW